jgi:hypothetical protein
MMDGQESTNHGRRELLRTAGLVTSAVLMGGATAIVSATPAEATTDTNFRWCRRCQGMWRSNAGNNGHCPVDHWWDHSHYQDGSGTYWSTDTHEIVDGVVDTFGFFLLKWCTTCKGVFFHREPTFCPNNSAGHTASAPAHKVEATFMSPLSPFPKQGGWRRCVRCAGLFFIGNGLNTTRCPRPHPSGWPYHLAAKLSDNTDEAYLIRHR